MRQNQVHKRERKLGESSEEELLVTEFDTIGFIKFSRLLASLNFFFYKKFLSPYVQQAAAIFEAVSFNTMPRIGARLTYASSLVFSL
jgi:hypothetical protein